MALVLADRVQETTTTTGTGSLTLAGAVSGFQSFAVVGNTNTCYYTIVDGTAWEVGIGTYSTTGPTLARTTVLSNSSGNTSPLTLAAGSKPVFLTYPAERSVNLDGSGNVSALGTVSSGTWQGTTVAVSYGGTGVTSSSGANSVMLRDANQNVSINRLNQSSTTTTAAGATTTLTAASTFSQILVGTGGQTFKLPDATTLTNTTTFEFNNNATGTLTITDNASATIGIITSGGAAAIALLSNGTIAGTWDVHAYIPENVTWGTNALALGSTVITGGTWNGGVISTAYGGTGLSGATPFTSGGAVYASSASALTSGTLPVSAGGTGAVTLTGYVKGTGTAALTASATIPNTDISGLGTMSTQAASAVAITGGTINGTTVGASTAATVRGTTITATTQVDYSGSTSGTTTLKAAAVAGATTITMPATTGTMALTSDLPTVNNGTLTLAVSGTGLSGSQTFTANQSSAATFTVTSNATSANTASTIVARDASGNFTAGTITAALSGNASTATTATNQSGGTLNATTGTVTPNTSGVSTGFNVVNGDITTYRSGGTTGVVYLSNSGSRYLYYDGTNYNLNGGAVIATNITAAGNVTGSSASCSGNAATATTATNQSGGTVSATTGTFSGLIKADGGTMQVGSSAGTYRQFRYDGTISSDGTNFYTLLNSNNYTSYSPSLTGSGASGTWGINVTGSSASCTGNAATATSATSLNSSNYISQKGSQGSWNADFQATPAGTAAYNGDVGANTTTNPGGTWWIQQNFRHTNATNYWGTQVAWGWEDNANRLATRNVTGGTYGSWVYYLNSSNYTSYAPSLTGSGASGTWGINVTGSSASCTGNAATATTATNATNATNATYLNGTAQTSLIIGKVSNVADINSANDAGSMSVRGDTSYPAVVSFHRAGAYAINCGLSTGNNFVIGGWSASSNCFVMSGSGALTMLNNITAYSDERVKTNWRDLRPDFIERLAEVKHGIYDRTDQVSTQVGVSAQSLQKILEQAVMEGEDGHLSVAYGNAALVAAVKLAERVVEQDVRIAKLEALVAKLVGA